MEGYWKGIREVGNNRGVLDLGESENSGEKQSQNYTGRRFWERLRMVLWEPFA